MDKQGEQMAVKDLDATLVVAVKQQNMKMFAFAFGGMVLLAVALALGVGIYRVYAKTATDSFSVAVASALRLPAAKVNDQTLFYTDYVKDFKAISTLRDYDRKNGGDAANLTDEQLSDQVLIRMVNNVLVNDQAREMGLKVDDSDIKEVYDQFKERFTTLEAAEQGLKDHYGWNLAQYESRVIRPLILQNKISEKITTDVPAREAIKAQAQIVLDQIKGGANFEDLAKQYGQDGTAPTGGDLGEFKPGDMVPEFESAVKALKKGQTSQALVESPYGYHIIRLDETRTEKIKDEKGKTVSQPVYHAHHILFMYPSINQKLAEKLKQTSFRLYIKAHNPLENPSAVVGQ